MSAVLGHFVDRTLPVVKHSEYVPARQRQGEIGFAKLLRLPRAAFRRRTMTPRKLLETFPAREKSRTKSQCCSSIKCFNCLWTDWQWRTVAMLSRSLTTIISPTCSNSRGTGLAQEFRHAEFREKVHDPTDNDQFPDVEDNADHGDRNYRRNNE